MLWSDPFLILAFVRCLSRAIWVTRQNPQLASPWTSNQVFAWGWWRWSENTTANHTLASASLIPPEAGIALLRRGVDDPVAITTNQRQFDALANGLGHSSRRAPRRQNRQQAAAFFGQPFQPARHDATMVNFDFDSQITHSASKSKRARLASQILPVFGGRAQDRILLGVILPGQSGPSVYRFLDTSRPAAH